MSKSAVVTARIDPETLAGLDRLSDYFDRSRAWLVAKAVKLYVEQESEFFSFIEEGEEAIARGDHVTHDDLVAELDGLIAAKKAA